MVRANSIAQLTPNASPAPPSSRSSISAHWIPNANPLPQPVTLASLLPDRPMTFNGWTPANYERNYQGTVTVAEALAESLNVPTAYLGSLLGPPRIIRTAHDSRHQRGSPRLYADHDWRGRGEPDRVDRRL